MIAHVVLYKFPDDLPDADRDAFVAELDKASVATGVVRRFEHGYHVSLPADEHVPHMVHSLATRWELDTVEDLHVFSQHPAMVDVVDRWVRARGIGVAFANFLVPAPDRAVPELQEVGT